MSVEKQTQWENHVQRLAADFPYPATPDLAPAVLALTTRRAQPRWHRSLQPAWVLIFVVVLLLAGLFTIPPVRAALLEWLQIGAVRIQLPAPLPTAMATDHQNLPAATVVRNQYPPTPTPFSSVLDVAGETTLLAAQAQVNFPLRLPALPADLGEPDHVYLQQTEGDMVILVWMRPEEPEQVRMSLHLLGPGAFAWKMQPPDVVEIQMNGEPAYWTQGPYYIKVGSGQSWGSVRLVNGHVLIWTAGEITYRLESDLSLADAIRVAESLE
ncbi:MAG: hypothetical protein R2867_21205 [Caldilineaceae bacterium]